MIRIRASKMIALIVALCPVLGVYKLGPINASIGDVLLICLLCYFLLSKRIIIERKTYFIWYLIVLSLTTFISIITQHSFQFSDVVNKWIKLLTYYSVIHYLATRGYDKETLYKTIINISSAVAIIVIIQWIALKVLKRVIFPYIPYIPLYYNITLEELKIQTVRWIAAGSWRPSAIFAEPSGFAEYVMLGLTISFFNNVKASSRIWVKRLIIVLGLLLCGSATGIFIAVVLFVFWYIYLARKKLTIWVVLGFLLAIPIGLYFVSTEFFTSAMSRLTSFNRAGGSSTANLRVLQGFNIFGQLPAFYKVFGVGFGNLKNYLIQNSITTPYLKDVGNESMSAVTTILNTGGIIGLILYITGFIKVWKSSVNQLAHMVLLMLLMMMFTSGMMYTSIYVTYFAIVCVELKQLKGINKGRKNVCSIAG